MLKTKKPKCKKKSVAANMKTKD